MTGSTHKIGGFTFALFVLWLNSIISFLPFMVISIYTPFFIIGCILGSLFPDIDSPTSTISRYLWIIAWPIWLIQKIIRLIFGKQKNTFAKNICKTVNHRGIMHWWLMAISYIVLVLALGKIEMFKDKFSFEITFFIFLYFILGTSFGNFSHVLLDTFNKTGTYIFAPFSFKRFKFAKVETGRRLNKHTIFTTSKSENAFIVILLVLILLLIYVNYKTYL